MRIQKIDIKNFRLLKDVSLFLEERTTVIVGRNNSGKTSLAELFRRLLSPDSTLSFRLEDFSLSTHECFWNAFILKSEDKSELDIRNALPIIEIKLTITYDTDAPSFGPLGDFIIDLNSDCKDALIVVRYQLKDGMIDTFFADIEYDPVGDQNSQRTTFFRTIRDRVKTSFAVSVVAEDPNDPTNQKPMENSKLRSLLQNGFISAQRGLDDTTHKDINLLGKILETLLQSAMSDLADTEDRTIAQNLESAVEDIQEGIDEGFNKQLQDLLPAFSLFGYPGLNDPKLLTETTLDVQRLLKDYTKVHYTGVNGINLPEAYNGLGVRNLIFILLKLLEFFKTFATRETEPGIHLIFIEEPEVHLHPQMQEVFIGKLNEIVDIFVQTFNGGLLWPVQFVVTTHSSHLANKSSFESMRYFLTSTDEQTDNFRSTRIKDLRVGLSGTSADDRDFLHKYMTLTRCDLLFADKAILVEGTTERLLMPKLVEKVEADRSITIPLSSQYVSVMEVGGAYAHLFFGLLDFLELRTLIITDLDTTKKNNENKLVACKVSEGTNTSNACIKQWFGDTNITPGDLIEKSDVEKVNGIRRLAYQIPEENGAPCGRSFEGAFILANSVIFDLSNGDKENKAWDITQSIKKSDFALKYAIDVINWNPPRYITEGLHWLEGETTAVIPTAELQTSVDPSGEEIIIDD